MLCPLCARALNTVEREGIEIDHCPQCGGFWLDQGELDKLIRREAMDAIQRGQDALMAARHEREYDRVAASAVPVSAIPTVATVAATPATTATRFATASARNVPASVSAEESRFVLCGR